MWLLLLSPSVSLKVVLLSYGDRYEMFLEIFGLFLLQVAIVREGQRWCMAFVLPLMAFAFISPWYQKGS